MKVFVTGASGFIGSHVTRELIRQGHEVLALGSAGTRMWRLSDMQGRFDILQARLEATDRLSEGLTAFRPDACIHLAWYAEPGKYLYSERNLDSLNQSLTLFRLLQDVDCQKIVMAGTCAEYDTDFGYLPEQTPLRPATPYAAAKLSCYFLCETMARSAGIDFAWGRIFFPYGPQENQGRLVPSSICNLIRHLRVPASSGDQVRDFIYVEDVAGAFCRLLRKEARGAFNISSGIPVTVRFLLESLEELMGRTGSIEFGSLPKRSWDPPFICGPNERLRRLGWQPEYSLDRGLTTTIEYWKERREVADIPE